MIVTIDGPAGVGKSTAARMLASSLGIAYLDTGATYRAVTLKALRENIELADPDAIADLARHADIRLTCRQDGVGVTLDGEDVSDDIRSLDVTNNAHYVAGCAAAREVLVALQRQIGSELGSFVAEGRDQGSVVFPDADVKFYIDADPEVRARRRCDELAAAGKPVALETVLADVLQRDDRDRSRPIAPLVKPDGAIEIDTTSKTVEQVFGELLRWVETRRCR